ncbi:hypothetical protein [Thaumasiovibrio subtropicus]|uniref:hypothetical protein n=1 Tax=Thaumasiovibrio subtropicus TaxID=1891207 RepID=UPI00131E11F7|nr:hypothetical protein [Thaumasiovibrio subtropicus]
MEIDGSQLPEPGLPSDAFKAHPLFPLFVVLLFSTMLSLMTSEFFFFDARLDLFGGIKAFWLIMFALGGALLVCTAYISNAVKHEDNNLLKTRHKTK